MKKITFTFLLIVTSFLSVSAQTMTFDSGASETGFSFSSWQTITAGTIAPVNLAVASTITRTGSGTWNATSIDITFAGNNTFTVTSDQGDSQSFSTNTGTINLSGFTGITTLSFSRTGGSGASPDFDNLVYTVNTGGDTTNPNAVCSNITRNLDASGNVTIMASDVDGGSTDNVGVATRSVSPSTFNCSDIGTNNVTLTITDAAGNSDTCMAVVTIADNTGPVVSNVNDITATLDASGMVTINNVSDVEPAVTATDNCGIQNIRILGGANRMFTCADIATNPNVREVRVRDVNGNNTFVNVNIIVVDDIAPTITCPADEARDADAGVCEYTVQGTEFDPTFDDNCTSATITNDYNNTATLDGAVLPVGDTLITWTVDDGNGQTLDCSFTVTINDNENPVVTDVQDIIAQLDENGTVTIGNGSDVANAVTATDNCGIQSYFVRGINGGTSNEARTFTCDDIATSPNVRTVRVRDVNGNDTDVAINVIVEDNLDPIVTDVQDIIAVLGPDGTVRLNNEDDVAPAITATDNCEILDIRITGGNGMTGLENRTFDCDDIANNPHLRRVRVRDVNGNRALVDVNVIVQDNTGVIITDGPVDIFTGTGPNGGECGAIVNYGEGITAFTFENNCGEDDSIVFEQTAGLGSGSFFPVGTTSEEFSFTDNNGNVTTYSFEVTITDTTLPTIDCPDDQVVSGDDDGNYTIEDYSGLIADNCSSGADLVITQEPEAGTVVTDPSTTVLTLTATDASGNTSTCSFDLIVDETLGLGDETVTENAIVTYPNPTAGQLTIKASNVPMETVVVYDLRGRVVVKKQVSQLSTTVDLTAFEAGVYLVNIVSGNTVVTKRVIKK